MKKYLVSIGIWFLIMPLAILNGILRETLLQPLGAYSLPVSGLLLCASFYASQFSSYQEFRVCRQGIPGLWVPSGSV